MLGGPEWEGQTLKKLFSTLVEAIPLVTVIKPSSKKRHQKKDMTLNERKSDTSPPVDLNKQTY